MQGKLTRDDNAGAVGSAALSVAALFFIAIMIIGFTANPVAIGTDVGERAPDVEGKAYNGTSWVEFDFESYFDNSWKEGNISGIRLTTARYYTPSGESIQGKGINPDIIVEQGEFESYEFKRYSESDLKDSLDKEDEDNTNYNTEEAGLSEKEERLAKDYQLKRALDLLKGLSIFEESFEE